MSTLFQSTNANEPVSSAGGASGRVRASESATSEVYGAEDLPVLIQLPDLRRDAAVDPPAPSPLTDPITDPDEPLAGLPAESEAMPSQEVASTLADQPPDSVAQRQLERRNRRRQREAPRRRTTGWIRGLGQLAFAALLAGILLSVIITIKEWNQEGPVPPAPQGLDRVESPAIDFGQPALTPPGNFFSEQDDQVEELEPVTSHGRTLQGVLPVDLTPDNTRAAGGPGSPFPAGLADGARGPAAGSSGAAFPPGTGFADAVDTAAPNRYPSTGVEPLTSPPAGPRYQAAEAWRETVPGGGTRNAQRPATNQYYQQR